MIIKTNISAMNMQRNWKRNLSKSNKNMEKLSSGSRINRAADDSAGLVISEKMRGQIRGLHVASRNAQDGINLIQTGEGALNEVHSMLDRMLELSVQSANGILTDEDRNSSQKEIDQLLNEIDSISENTHFNKVYLLKDQFEGGSGAAIEVNGTPKVGNTEVDTKAEFILDFSKIDTNKLPINKNTIYYLKADNKRLTFENRRSGATNTVGLAQAFNNFTFNYNGNEYKIISITGTSQVKIESSNQGNKSVDLNKLKDNIRIGINGTSIECDPLDMTIIQQGAKSEAGTITFNLDGDKLNDGGKITAAGREFIIREENKPTNLADIEENALYMGTSTYSSENVIDKIIDKLSTNDTYDISKIGSGNSAQIKFVEKDDKRYTCKTEQQLKNLFKYDKPGKEIYLQIGANKNETINLELKSTSCKNLGIAKLDIGTIKKADNAISIIHTAIEKTSNIRANLGAVQNRLEHTIASLDIYSENLTASESRIRDTDMAKSIMEHVKLSILSQASQSMMSQVINKPQEVLQLLK